MPESERHTNRSAISRDTLLQIPHIKDVAPLALDAIAKIRLFAVDVPFNAYVCGFDGDDTCYGLMIARSVRLGELYLSGLDAACLIWDAHIAQDSGFQPTPLCAILLQNIETPDPLSLHYGPRNHQHGLMARAQVCLVLGREYHHPSTYKSWRDDMTD